MTYFGYIKRKTSWAFVESRYSEWNFLLLCFLLQLALIFQGVDLADSGFNATFYQQLFDHPVSVEYNFMFWLTGIIGASFYKLFGFLGLWGIRLLGVMVNTTTVWISYRLLSRHLPKAYTIIGLLIVLFWLNNDIKELNYNSLSALLNLSIIAFLYHGCHSRGNRFILLAGVFCALNVFVRLPNLLTMGFASAIIFSGLIRNQSVSAIVRSLVFFLSGFLGTVIIVVACMHWMGHWDHYKNATAIVLNLASGKSAQNAMENSYGAVTLVKQSIYQTLLSINYAAYMGIYLLLIYVLHAMADKINARFRWLPLLIAYGTYLIVIILFIKQSISYSPFLVLLTGVGILLSIPYLLQKEDEGLRLLAFLGLFLLLYYPFGSSSGIFTAGRYSFWIAVPLGLGYFFQFRSFKIDFLLHTRQGDRSLSMLFSEKYLNICKRVLTIFCLGSGLYFSYNYPFFDKKNRMNMTHAINNPQLRWIYTTKGRAEAVNELLQACKVHTAPGDLVLAYDDIPMVHFATHTVPFLHNSMPWLYPANIFARDLSASFDFYKKAPIIIRQKVKTFGDGAGWPEQLLPEAYDKWEVNKERNRIMDAFIAAHHYQQVWTSPYFSILKPEMEK